MKADIRFVVARDIIYLRKEDVVEYIRELSAGEETDVRNRLEEGAKQIQNMKVKK